MSYDQWAFEATLDTKRFLQKQKNLELSMQRFEGRVAKLKADTARQEVKAAQQVTAAKTKSEQAQRRQQDKTAAQQERLRAKEKAKQARFEKWKLTQFRSTSFARLSLEQKMNLKRILNSGDAEEKIRDQYQKTTAIYRREMQRRAAYAKKQRSVTGGAAGARGGALAGGAMALASNPYALAAGAAVAGGGMLVNSGAQQFTELQRGSELTGVGVQQLQRDAFVAENLTGMSAEQYADKLKDINEKSKDFRANSEFDAETGMFRGGGEGLDSANELLRAGLKPQEVKELFSQNDPTKILDALNKTLANADVGTRTLAFDSLANDLTGLANALQNTERRTAAEQTYDRMNLGFSDEDLQRIEQATLATQGFFSVIGNAPLQAFKSFASNLSPQTLDMLGSLGELIVNVSGIIGDVLAVALNTLSPILNPLIQVINWVIGGIKKLTGWLADMTSGITDLWDLFKFFIPVLNLVDEGFKSLFGMTLGDMFRGWIDDVGNGLSMFKDFMIRAFRGWFKDLTDALPDWMTPDSWKQNGDDMPTPANNSSVSNSGYNAPNSYQLRAQASRKQLPSMNNTNPYALRAQAAMQAQQVQVANTASVNLHLDGQQIANVVVDSEDFREAQNKHFREVSRRND